MRTVLIFIAILMACSLSFSQKKPIQKDTVIWISKAEILKYNEQQIKYMEDSKAQYVGQNTLISQMPDSVNGKPTMLPIVQKKRE